MQQHQQQWQLHHLITSNNNCYPHSIKSYINSKNLCYISLLTSEFQSSVLLTNDITTKKRERERKRESACLWKHGLMHCVYNKWFIVMDCQIEMWNLYFCVYAEIDGKRDRGELRKIEGRISSIWNWIISIVEAYVIEIISQHREGTKNYYWQMLKWAHVSISTKLDEYRKTYKRIRHKTALNAGRKVRHWFSMQKSVRFSRKWLEAQDYMHCIR